MDPTVIATVNATDPMDMADAAAQGECLPDCPVQRAAQVVDGKWTTLIVRDLLGGAKRFSELQRSVGRVSPRLLTARLRLLEQEGVLTRSVYPTNPPTTDYALTEHGRRLHAVIAAMAAFGLAAQARDQTVAAMAAEAAQAAAADPRSRVHRLR